jgi:hypothetical protein
MPSTRRLWCATVATLVLNACAGSAGSGPPPSGSRQTSSAEIAITLKVPAETRSTRRRVPAYVSQATRSAVLTINASLAVAFDTTAGSNANCTSGSAATTCTATVAAPIGVDTFSLSTYDGGLNAMDRPTGNLLSTGTLVQQVLAGTANAVNLVLSGAVHTLAVTVPSNTLTVGTPGRSAVVVDAFDADGFAIVGSPAYVDASGNPLAVTLSDADPAGTTRLSGLAISGSGGSVTMSYDGTPPHGLYPTVTASAAGIAPARALVPIAPATREFHLSGSARGIVAAPNGVLYVSERSFGGESQSAIATISTSGAVTERELSTTDPFGSLAIGGDGRLYIGLTSYGGVTSDGLDIYDPLSGALSSETFAPSGGTSPATSGDVALGADGRIWALGSGPCFLAALTTGGTVTTYSYAGDGGCGAGSIVLGPDRRLWFPGPTGLFAASSTGAVTAFPVPDTTIAGNAFNRFVEELATAPNGVLWAHVDLSGEAGPQEGCEAASVAPSSGTLTDVPNAFMGGLGTSCEAAVVDARGDLWLAVVVSYFAIESNTIVRTDPAGNTTSLTPARDYPADFDFFASQTVRDASGNIYFLASNQFGRQFGKVMEILY